MPDGLCRLPVQVQQRANAKIWGARPARAAMACAIPCFHRGCVLLCNAAQGSHSPITVLHMVCSESGLPTLSCAAHHFVAQHSRVPRRISPTRMLPQVCLPLHFCQPITRHIAWSRVCLIPQRGRLLRLGPKDWERRCYGSACHQYCKQ